MMEGIARREQEGKLSEKRDRKTGREMNDEIFL
jgi:hypothetical protein